MPNPERHQDNVSVTANRIASLITEKPDDLERTVIETVRGEALQHRLLRFVLEGRVDQLCAMPAAAAADVIGQKDFGMTPSKAARLYNFVKANNMLTFNPELQGRRIIPHFTPRGLLAYVGLANEDVKGIRRQKLFQNTYAKLGAELGNELHETAKVNTSQKKDNAVVQKTSQENFVRPSFIRDVPKFTRQQLSVLAQLTPQHYSDWLATIPGTDFDAVTIPPDIFPAVSTVMLLVAAETCVQTGTYAALKEFDPSLSAVNKQELRHGALLAEDRFFKNHPERRNFAQLYNVLMLWFEKKAVKQIEWRED